MEGETSRWREILFVWYLLGSQSRIISLASVLIMIAVFGKKYGKKRGIESGLNSLVICYFLEYSSLSEKEIIAHQFKHINATFL